MLGLVPGDAHIIRNAGGLATDDAIRSLSASQRLLGTEEIVVVMHEGCGLKGASEDDFAAALAADGVLPNWRLGAFEDLDATRATASAACARAPELSHRDRIRGSRLRPRERGPARGGRSPRRVLQLGWPRAMRAVTFQAPGVVTLEERPQPEPQSPTDAVVRIELSGVCGSDLHIYHGRVQIEPGFTIRPSTSARSWRLAIRSRAWLSGTACWVAPDRRRRLLLLPPRPLSPLSELAHLRARGRARSHCRGPRPRWL